MAWLTGWQYRKQVTITGQTGAGTNYQVLLKVGESSGAAGCDFHVSEHSLDFPLAKNDSGDLRFTDNDGETLLNFWVEKVEGTTPNRIAYCWIKVVDTLESNANIYCYYAKSGASNVSNGDNTFQFFDDFEGTTIDEDKWYIGFGNASVASSILSLDSYTPDDFIDIFASYWVGDFTSPFAIESYLKNSDDNKYAGIFFDLTPTDSGYGYLADLPILGEDIGDYDIDSCIDGEITLLAGHEASAIDDDYRRITIKHYLDTGYYHFIKIYENNILKLSTSQTNHMNGYIGIKGTDSSPTYADWIAVRKCVVTEPSFNSVSIEESGSVQKTITSDIHFKAEDVQKTITSDIVFTVNTQKTITSDVHFKAVDVQKEINSNISFVNQFIKTIFSDIYFSSRLQKTIYSNIHFLAPIFYNINNKINTIKQTLSNINNQCSFVKRVLNDVNNMINFVKGNIYDINNKVNTKLQGLYNINNDVRFIKSWQVPTAVGIQSLGKEYIKVYITDMINENTDVNIDSININKGVNQSHTASFELSKAYDSTKPDMKAPVLIKYSDWTLYKGYITSIVPGDNPESIRIECQNKHWEDDQTNKYFSVGHRPTDNKELYYETIQSAIAAEFSWNIDIGNFVPETINCFGMGQAQALANLFEQCGNFGFFYDVDETKKIWRAGQGSVITLNRQQLGNNLKLYDVIEHKFTEDISQIVNKYRVQMGNKVIRKFNSSGGSRTYEGYNYERYEEYIQPAWDGQRERLAPVSGTGYGFGDAKHGEENLYKNVFQKYTLPYLDPKLSSWDDRFAPRIEIYNPSGWEVWNAPEGIPNPFTGIIDVYRLTEGFTIDYENAIITLSDKIYLYLRNRLGECTHVKAPTIRVFLWKKNFWTVTLDPGDDPETDISNPLMFFTDKVGDYPDTIIKDLNLSSYSIQQGTESYDAQGNKILIPSWDDTEFAKDYAYWQLSKSCDKKISGNIVVTLDAACYYGIDLTKRIFIDGITEDNMNIVSMNYNISNFTVNIELENSKLFQRTISLPTRGE